MFFLATCVYLLGTLPVRLATQRKSLRKFNLLLLATTCDSVWPRLKRRRERKTSEPIQKLLTSEEEEPLWKSGQLGSGNPRALINTMWWLLTQHFGLRGRQEHHNMKVEDFCLQRDDDGIEYLTFAEGPTKNEARRAKGQTPTGYTEDVCHRQ